MLRATMSEARSMVSPFTRTAVLLALLTGFVISGLRGPIALAVLFMIGSVGTALLMRRSPGR
jgi:hypothetical protein